MTDTPEPLDVVSLHVWGTPVQQGSKSVVPTGAGPRLVEGRSKRQRSRHKAWRAAVADAARRALDERDGRQLGDPDATHHAPLFAIVALCMPKPKAKPKYLRWHRTMPDLDKLLRATLDGVATDSGLIDDDARIAAVFATKRYALAGEAPGAAVTLVVVDEGDDVAVELRRGHEVALGWSADSLRLMPSIAPSFAQPSLFGTSDAPYDDIEVIPQ